MRGFAMPLEAVLGTRKRLFFWMHHQLCRLEAEEDLRALKVIAAANSDQEGFEKTWRSFSETIGVTTTYGGFIPGTAPKIEVNEKGLDPEFDREALRALKARHGA